MYLTGGAQSGMKHVLCLDAICMSYMQVRQLETVLSLAEAMARVELREEVTREDAEVSHEFRIWG